MRKIIVIIFIIVITVITIISPVRAQTAPPPAGMLRVSPIILNISLSPGKLYTYDITVENLLDIPLPIRAMTENFESSDEEGNYNLNPANQPSPFLSWIKIENPDMIIPAQSKRNIPVTVKIPDVVPVGGYYAIIFLEPILPHNQLYSNLIQSRIGVIMLANVGVPNYPGEKGRIVRFAPKKNFVYREPVELSLSFKNTSLFHYSAKPFIVIESLWADPIQKEIEEKVVLPGKTRSWKNTVELPSYNRIVYKITARVSTGQGNFIDATTYVFAFPLTKTLILTSVIIMLFIVIRKRRKFREAVSEFFR